MFLHCHGSAQFWCLEIDCFILGENQSTNKWKETSSPVGVTDPKKVNSFLCFLDCNVQVWTHLSNKHCNFHFLSFSHAIVPKTKAFCTFYNFSLLFLAKICVPKTMWNRYQKFTLLFLPTNQCVEGGFTNERKIFSFSLLSLPKKSKYLIGCHHMQKIKILAL